MSDQVSLQLDRMALDEVGYSSKKLAAEIHRQLTLQSVGQGGAVPVHKIALALDIIEIKEEPLDGFEGALLTNTERSYGSILANSKYGRRRSRFTVAHELLHFLNDRHVQTEGGFHCRKQDIRPASHALRAGISRHQRQETEANDFAIELLAPHYRVSPFLSSNPDLRQAQRMRDDLDLSLEACLRRMVALSNLPLAAIWSQHGKVRYPVRNSKFPSILMNKDMALPSNTQAFSATANQKTGFTEMTQTHALNWTRVPDLELFEQTRVGANGHAVTLLHADFVDQDADEQDDGGVEELGIPQFRR